MKTKAFRLSRVSFPKAIRWLGFLSVAVASFTFPSDLGAAVVISYQGPDNPALGVWTRSSLSINNSVEAIPSEGAWQTKDNSDVPTSGGVFYSANAADYASDAAQGWRLSARVSLIDASAASVAMLAYTDNEGRSYYLSFDAHRVTGNTRVLALNALTGSYRYFDTGTSGYIDYHMVYDGNPDKTVSVYIGDSAIPVIQDYAGFDNQSNWSNTVQWGTNRGEGTAILHWKSVEFAVIPEADTALLTFIGSGILAYCFMRQRRRSARIPAGQEL